MISFFFFFLHSLRHRDGKMEDAVCSWSFVVCSSRRTSATTLTEARAPATIAAAWLGDIWRELAHRAVQRSEAQIEIQTSMTHGDLVVRFYIGFSVAMEFDPRQWSTAGRVLATSVARPSGVRGQGTARDPQTNGIILVGGTRDRRGPWTLSTLSTHLLRPWFYSSSVSRSLAHLLCGL